MISCCEFISFFNLTSALAFILLSMLGFLLSSSDIRVEALASSIEISFPDDFTFSNICAISISSLNVDIDLLKNYINNISNTNSLREFVDYEVLKTKTELKKHFPKVSDKITTWKYFLMF